MIKASLIGLGKMGISHLAIMNAHPGAEVVGVCDTSGFITGCLGKVTDLAYFDDYRKMIKERSPDCVMIATPTSSHMKIVMDCLDAGLHVFVEKPLALGLDDAEAMSRRVESAGRVNQVGYHNKFVGAFKRVKSLLENGAIGEVYAIRGEAYGPVVLKPKGSTWRSRKDEGGGCLHDYASHVLDLMNWFVGPPERVGGTIFRKVFSRGVEDAVYSTLFYRSGIAGQLSVNWSEPTYRKMSTIVTLQGTGGKIEADRQECKVYLEAERPDFGLRSGWNILYTTELTEPTWFYLRGEEYSAQIDYFISCVSGAATPGINSFRSALETDRVIGMLASDAERGGE